MTGKLLPAALFVMLAGAAPAMAEIGAPAELPPAGFDGRQYVDSRGCVFLRASYQGREQWVPRLSPDRKQLCGYAPSLQGVASSTGAATSEPPAPIAQPEAPSAVAGTKPAPADKARAKPKGKAKAKATRSKSNFAVKLPDARPRTAISGEVVTIDGSSFRLTCPVGASVPRSFALHGGGHTLLCTKGDGTLEGATSPRLATKVAAGKPEKSRVPAMDTGAARFFVQVGAFGVEKNAQRTVGQLQGLGLPVVDKAGKGGALRLIYAGPFGSVQEAHTALRQVQSIGFGDAVIVK